MPVPVLFPSLASAIDEESKDTFAIPASTQAPSPPIQGMPKWSSSSVEGIVPTKPLVLPNRNVLYVNLVVLNATGAIDKQLHREYKDIPKPIHQLASQLVNTWATPERAAEVLSTDLCTNLVEEMALRGMTARAQTVFWEGPLVVLQVQIESVRLSAMVEARSKNFYDEFGDLDEAAHISQALARRLKGCLESILFCLGMKTQKSLEDEYLPWLIQSTIKRQIEGNIQRKLRRRGLNVITKVLSEGKQDQAQYFFDSLHRVRQARRPFTNFEESFTSINEARKSQGEKWLAYEKKVI